jgi:hypothetical protein
MLTAPEKTRYDSSIAVPAWQRDRTENWWSQRREATLNWLALGVLLAAWNATDVEASAPVRRRPEALRGYACVSVRASSSALRPSYLCKSHKSVNIL